jgi:hypothetical protein
LLLLAISFGLVTYYALHQGTYSLIDRQQMAVFIWVAIGVAAICGVLPAVRPPKVLLVPLLALVALAAWTLISLSWTESAERTFNEFARIIGYLGVLVLIWLGVGRRTWRLVAAGLLSAGVLVCFLILLSRLWPSVFPSDTVAANLKTTRINYPFGYWNAVGCWCAMTVTLCLAYSAHARSAVVRGLALAVIPVCSAGLYMAVSRAGFGGALIGAAVVVLLAENRWLTFGQAVLAAGGCAALTASIDAHQEIALGRGTEGAGAVVLVAFLAGAVLFAVGFFAARAGLGEKLRMRPEVGKPLGIAGLVVALTVGVVLLASFGPKAYDQFTGKDVVVAGRESPDRLAQLNGNRHNLWDSAWRAVKSDSVGGIGPGTFEFWWSRDGVNGEFVRDVHNIYLEALTETGVVGLALLLTFFGGFLLSADFARAELRKRRSDGVGIQAGLVAVFVVFGVQAAADWMWESTAVAVFALGAIALAAVGSSPSRRTGVDASASMAILVAAVLAVIVMLPGLASQRQVERSQAAFRSGDFNAALSHADDAIDAESWSATAFGQRALALEGAGDLGAAGDAIAIAQEKEPYNWRWPLVASRIYVALGDAEAATIELRRTESLRPFLPMFGRQEGAFR